MKFSLRKNKKIEKKVRPAYVTMTPRVDNSNILAQAKKRQKKSIKQAKVIHPAVFVNFPLKKIGIVLLIILPIVALYLFLRNTSIFDVKEVTLISDNQENFQKVLNIIEEYKGKNILFVPDQEVEGKIKDAVPAIHTVFINKTLAGKLKVEVIEDVPVYYEANNTGIYLINQSGEVMKVIAPEYILKFDETEELVKDNKLPYDSDQVRVKYLSKFPEEERNDIIWKDVPREEKEETLNLMKSEVNQKIADSVNKLSEQIKGDEFRNLIGSYIPNDQRYQVGDQLSLESLNFISIVLDFVKSKNFVVEKVVWESDYSLEVILENNPSILFSIKRGYTAQFSDLNTLIYHGQFNGARVVDVRSSNYSVIR